MLHYFSHLPKESWIRLESVHISTVIRCMINTIKFTTYDKTSRYTPMYSDALLFLSSFLFSSLLISLRFSFSYWSTMNENDWTLADLPIRPGRIESNRDTSKVFQLIHDLDLNSSKFACSLVLCSSAFVLINWHPHWMCKWVKQNSFHTAKWTNGTNKRFRWK